MNENHTSFYITFEYKDRGRIQEKDAILGKYLKKKIKGAELERFIERDAKTRSGIAMRWSAPAKKIDRLTEQVTSRFKWVKSINVMYPGTYE